MLVSRKENIDLLIIVPRSMQKTIYPPYGAMYIASAVRKKGHNPQIINAHTDLIADRELIDKIRRLNPKYIGFSGIVAPSYKYVKDVSLELRDEFPDKIQILGGGLANAVEPVFKNTSIDIVVQGEGDLTIVDLLECLDNRGNLDNVPGIYYRNGPSYVYTGKRGVITNLDILPYPAFDLIDMDKYMPDGLEFIRYFTTKIKDKRIYDPKRNRKMLTLPTSRGCFAQCSFCFRAYPGIRVHSMKYTFDFIEYCIEKFNPGFFTLGDECFAPNKTRNWEFIEEYKRRKMNFVFRILGMRVDTVDREILRAYKEIGCWMIEYGFESGSQKMLNIIDKRVTVEQNRQVALWTQEAGIYTSPTLVLGMPGETEATIQESIDFIKSLKFGFKQYQWSYALPIPGAPLYDFGRITGAIEDEDEYLSSLDDYSNKKGMGVFQVNLTDEPDEVISGWADKVKNVVDDAYFKEKYKNPLIAKIMSLFKKIELHYRRKDLMFVWIIAKAKIKSLISPSLKNKGNLAAPELIVRFKKRKDINIEDLLKGLDSSIINREMALRKINQKLSQDLQAKSPVNKG